MKTKIHQENEILEHKVAALKGRDTQPSTCTTKDRQYRCAAPSLDPVGKGEVWI